MKLIPLPYWFIKFSYNNPEIYKMGYFIAFLCLLLIVYKISATRANNTFKRYLIYVFAMGILRCGFLAFFYDPYYYGMFPSLLELPQLIAVINLAVYTVRRYGVGGTES